MLEIILGTLAMLLVVCPPSLDPAIRWKERNEARRAKAKRTLK